jgi:hypothetical protein
MKAYLLKDRELERASTSYGKEPQIKGVTLYESTAEKWKGSSVDRDYETIPLVEAREKVTYEFVERDAESEEIEENFADMFPE